MKSLTSPEDDCDDIFGPPRTYPNGFYPPRNRPTMISAKYRQKEERRKVLKISMNKLKKIEDPEAWLCRSVLINNTLKRLQQEAKEEKLQKQQLHYPRSCENQDLLKSDYTKNEQIKPMEIRDNVIELEKDFDRKLAEEIEIVKAKSLEVLGNFEESINCLDTTLLSSTNTTNNDRFSSRKRSFDDIDDCDVQDVLSQFYIPPTPRMLTCIDEDDDINVTSDDPPPKRIKSEECCDSSYTKETFCDVTVDKSCDDFSSLYNNNNISNDSRLRYNQNDDLNSFSCGQASMFSEVQNNVYHNLIASLET